ncbi:MAG: hypothetical protein COV30_00065, partial [Candidatus Yanofskybacteria bacterium CG10_big_fil_rev_8_21_14_0_10_37_15]
MKNRKVAFEKLLDFINFSNKDFLIELGEETGIGSSSLLVRKCGKIILVDRGLAFEGSGQTKITNFPAGGNLEGIKIDLMIFTHIHLDHIGLIVPTVLAHPESRVIFSEKTFEELKKVILPDSLIIQRKESRKAYFDGLPALPVKFNKEDVDLFLNQAEGDCFDIIDIDEKEDDIWISYDDWPGWNFGFTFSGHTKGAFISLVKCPDGDGFVFSGDVSGHDQETTRGVKALSEVFLEMEKFRDCKRIILVTEATNGNRDREESQEKMDARLKAILNETERQGGNALFPVFMVNRGPNIVAKLVRLGFKVFVAGGVRKTLAIEVGTEIVEKWQAEGTVMFIENGPNYQTMLRMAACGEFGFRPVVTSSATLDQGAGVDFAIEMLPNPENVLISTGHRFDGSAMKEFFEIKNKPLERGTTITLNKLDKFSRPVKNIVNVRCQGEHFDYSAHSYKSELVEFAANINPDFIFVKHCMEEGFEGFKSAFLKNSKNKKRPPIIRA